ncbi:MAG: acyl-CoA dehydratase activase-related protein [Tannerella sp.]|jgi:predicted CoA-substrate-specific enzyme activase|nr:acyl-CoA dehydratase activase-related protein [Tannerella sp.]
MKSVDITYKTGIDVGSTTLKIIVLDAAGSIAYKSYRRHKANINGVFAEEARLITDRFPGVRFQVKITGSAGMGISERTGIPFMQEVVASVEVIKRMYPGIQTLIDLGGEDSKMVFFQAGRPPDIRMNGSCAGGTGSFIDQMADLMNISVEKLGEEALKCEKIYPVASRCGVFAKTDVQNLISRNIPAADIAGSILHTVVLQNITSLARGREITPAILCTGGPLTFLPALRDSFREVLKLDASGLILPENSEYFPAWGCALSCREEDEMQDPAAVAASMAASAPAVTENALPALFRDEAEYEDWKSKRKIKHLKRAAPGGRENIRCFLGIDSGSTTTKILIMDEDGQLVYTFYASNRGNPLKKAVEGLEQFYREAREKGLSFRFVASAATGYGEDLVKSALGLDFGIVETMAHLSGARYVDPDVSFVLDIGGQDIKSIFTEKGVISNIELNESCSSGCGSFLQNFAAAMNLSLPEFTKQACLARSPSDLGSRCTVFMNSKVKQALRQNDTLGDIAAGLAYSVVKNCLFKVLKISNLNRLGDHIVVQGGTFRNDAVYRALELLSGKTVSSTDSPELMGALGAALYARERMPHRTSFTGKEALPDVDGIDTKELQCKGCTNKCTVLRMKFENGNVCYAGNKCEKVFYSNRAAAVKGYNAFEHKYAVLFDRKADVAGPALKIGIPRVLNMYEDYPFWHALLAGCGLEAVLSPESTFPLYQKGVGSVMSDNICFPAKLVHGHILSLAGCGVDRIFYPVIPKEEKEFDGSCNSFNCPVVSGYPDVIRSAMDPEAKYGIPFDRPVITFHDPKVLERGCRAWLASLGVAAAVFKKAFGEAQEERRRYRQQIYTHQKQLLDAAVAENRPVFIVAGRPYHTDPLIHQKVGQILSGLGVTVLTEDVFSTGPGEGFGHLNIVSQWSYPNRVIQAAMEVARLPRNVQLIQLNSFGCGPDSFFMDEAAGILRQAGKNHTVLRIDEIASPGSIRLRLRSLIESLQSAGSPAEKRPFRGYAGKYTEEDRRKTILVPWFADFISPFVPAVGKLLGYTVENLPRSSKTSAEAGLKYGHNEVCYPSILILGDIVTALRSGRYDPEEVVVAITQTGGQCRATNYLSQIKSGLENSGFPRIPVVVLSTGEVYRNEQDAFKLPVRKYAGIIIYGVLYGDALQQMYSSTVIREKKKGEAQQLFDFYMEQGVEAVRRNDSGLLLKLLEQAVADFNRVPVHRREYPKVGLVGEIFVKYNNYGQAHTTEWLRERDVEVVTPPVIDFFMQYFVNSKVNIQNGISPDSLLQKLLTPLLRQYMNRRMNRVESVMRKYRFHTPAESICAKAEYASEVLDLSHQFGEGWMIAAEVACYARAGIHKVVCLQPFGCIANHIVAKGIEKRLKKIYPEVSLYFLDIDGGMAEVNIQNRLHFLVT